MSIKIEGSRNITNASAIDLKVRLQIHHMLITIESSRNITNASANKYSYRPQSPTSNCNDCLCVRLQIDQMSIKIESSRNITNVPAISPTSNGKGCDFE